MTTWIVRADRNALDLELVQEDLDELGRTIEGLEIELIPATDWVSAIESNHMRDFVEIGAMSAGNVRILDIVAEELLAEFGFNVDFKK